MRITFRSRPATPDGAIAVGLWRGRLATPSFTALDGDGSLSRALKRLDFDGDAEETELLLAPRPPLDLLVVFGLGKGRKLTPKKLRRIGGALLDELDESRAKAVTVFVDLPPDQVAELAYGLRLKGYRPLSKYRTKYDPDDEDDIQPVLESVVIACAEPEEAERLFAAREAVAQGVFLARDLTDEPGNALGPQDFVERARLLTALGVEVTVLDEAAIRDQGLNLLAAVGQGSARPPRLVLLRWKGAEGRPLVLVGKGITFDTGGITIKFDDEDMDAMKADMAGAAAVTGAIRAVAGRKAKAHVCGVLALAENMPSGSAQRPGDVVMSFSGQSVEVIDTDAEGRLVLADVLWYVAKKFKPKFMIDLATLTGAIMVALGTQHAGLFSNNDELAERLTKIGLDTDERVWRMPLGPDYDKMIDSQFADVKNAGVRNGGSITAAQFLQRFVDNTPWAHLDIAGTAMGAPKTEINHSWGSGYGVRLLERLVSEYYEK